MDAVFSIPQFGGLALTVLAFIVALSIIVFVHEYGHYIVGRWSGIHSEVFSLGFGPVLWSRVDKRGTRWQIAALPFGGYVKFMGDGNAASAKADESVMAALSPEERRRTMHGAPLWARAATVAAGPAFNFAMSILVFAGFFLWMGVPVDRPVVGELRATPFAGDTLRAGDRITALDGTPTPDFETFMQVAGDLPPAATVDYTVERDGTVAVLRGPHPMPPLAAFIQPQSAASAAGLQPGDVITAVDGTPIAAFSELRERVGASGGQAL
ncbi:MAG: metalloprotease RseP, partial [Pseudomonadota bacterium]